MAFQEVKVENAITLTKFPNHPLTGYYLGHRTITSSFKEQIIHDLKIVGGEKDGKKVSIYGFTSLNRSLESVEAGTLVRVTYLGKSTEKNKYGNTSHICRVEFDSEKVDETLKTQQHEEGAQDGTDDDLPF